MWGRGRGCRGRGWNKGNVNIKDCQLFNRVMGSGERNLVFTTNRVTCCGVIGKWYRDRGRANCGSNEG